MILILVSALVALLLGLADDVRTVNPILRLCGEILAALLLVFAGLTVSAVPFAPIAIFLTFFIVLASINSVNLIDGLDGLAAGTTIIASAGFLVLSIQNQSNLGIILSLALMGSALAFLLYNFNPASIFMGDAGSYFLGCALAILFVLNTGKSPPSPPLIKGGIRGGDFNSLIASALIMGVFIFDTGLAIMRRWLNGRPIFQGDRSHFYDQLKDRGLSTIQTVVVCYAVEAAFVILGLTAKQLPLMWAIVLLFLVIAVCASVTMRFGMLTMEK
ncbi:MAG: undecaprenyl/decaprenyl-phosphate alpha-N-acetylglucosaminyl 1-phosphate transferase [Deltaproteobacteria bacterium]|nr:undecaprenyl/decaprenyl-phosphate alpha-N-acetylglucosaminyl 1-phosphate transferase [Deltaproteobacteria bacterium]